MHQGLFYKIPSTSLLKRTFALLNIKNDDKIINNEIKYMIEMVGNLTKHDRRFFNYVNWKFQLQLRVN